MPDQYAELRALPIQSILFWLGVREEWKTRKNGTEFYGRCPVHQAKRNTTSFSFDQHKFHCFSCQAKGAGAIDLVMAVRKVGFQEAVEILKPFDWNEHANQAVPEAPRQRLVTAITENPPFKGTYDKFFVPSEWLTKRGFSQETLDYFGVGQYDNPKRQSAYKGKILLPVKRFKDGELVGYLARTPEPAEGEPKYVWPKGFAKSLEVFGAYRLKEKAPLRVAYIVESPFCVLKFHQLGLPAVSPFGAFLSPEQVTILRQLAKGWIVLPDRDKHGAISESVKALSAFCWVKCPELPERVTDPEHMSLEQIRALS